MNPSRKKASLSDFLDAPRRPQVQVVFAAFVVNVALLIRYSQLLSEIPE